MSARDSNAVDNSTPSSSVFSMSKPSGRSPDWIESTRGAEVRPPETAGRNRLAIDWHQFFEAFDDFLSTFRRQIAARCLGCLSARLVIEVKVGHVQQLRDAAELVGKGRDADPVPVRRQAQRIGLARIHPARQF